MEFKAIQAAQRGLMLELSLLGGFDARTQQGDKVVLPTRKARALLAYLALHPDAAISRQSLATLLWSDRAEPQANNSLSQAVTAIRKALAGVNPQPLVATPESLKISSTAVAVDALDFEAMSTSVDLAGLERTEGLYRGELLDDLGVRDPVFEDWVESERRRLHALAVEALTRLLDMRFAENQQQELVATAQRLLKLDPLHEAAHRALMRFYARKDQVGLALDQYDRCADILRRELGVEPSAETKQERDMIIARRSISATDGTPRESDVAFVPDRLGDEAHAAPPSTAIEVRGARRTRIRQVFLSAAMLLLVAIGGLSLRTYLRAPVPQEQSIVVLPFSNLSSESEQQWFADGMTEELITGLSKVAGLFVISRNTTMAYKGRDIRPREVARDLKVRYVLDGSVRRSGDQLRINARLTDSASEGNVWADSFDGTTADVFALQDRITERIVKALALELLPGDGADDRRAGTGNVEALNAFNMGRFHYYRRTPKDNARARAYFRKAVEIDPDYSEAYTALAKVYVRAALGEQAYADELGIYWTEGFTQAARMLTKGMVRPNHDAHVLNSWLALRKLQYNHAIAEAEAALALNPNDVEALEALAEALTYAGRPQEGIVQAQKAMAQNPLLLGRPLYLMGLAEFAMGHAAKAVDHLKHAIEAAPSRKPEFSGILAAAHGELGQRAEAEKAFESYQGGLVNRPALAWSVGAQPFQNPRTHTWWRVDLAWAVYAHPFAKREVLDRLANGLKVAGATESIGGFLPFFVENGLSGKEIKELLMGTTIRGRSLSPGTGVWQQDRTEDGTVKHSGFPIHPGLDKTAKGTSRIEGDRLCDHWEGHEARLETCVVVYRLSAPNSRLRWGDYALITDTGPYPFTLIQ